MGELAQTVKTKSAALALRHFTVQEIKWETPDIFTLVLVPDGSESMFSFQPGQWVFLHLLKADGSSLARAAFSIATAPEESNAQLELGIKVYGSFTKLASQLIPGDRVDLQGPFGVFTLREQVSPLVLFAGGIGVTPFRSMIHSLAARKAGAEVILFYSNKRVEDIAYFDELNKIAETWPGLRLVYLLTEHAPSKWQGEIGRLNAEILKKHVMDFQQGEFLMCGPPGFMETVEKLLKEQNVDTKKRLHRELFG